MRLFIDFGRANFNHANESLEAINAGLSPQTSDRILGVRL